MANSSSSSKDKSSRNVSDSGSRSSNNSTSSSSKQKSKGAIGLMAGMIFNRGGKTVPPTPTPAPTPINTNRSSGNNNSSNNNRNQEDQGRGGSHRRSRGGLPENPRGGHSQNNRPKRNTNNSNNSNNSSSNTNTNTNNSSAQKSTTQDQNQLEMLLPSVGLSGPTQFEFSPSGGDQHQNQQQQQRQQRYLSFLSCHIPTPTSNASNKNSPVRSTTPMASNEKRLCVMDLHPFYKTIDAMEKETDQQEYEHEHENEHHEQINETTHDSNNYDTNKTITINNNPITDPNLLMDQHVTPLLNTTLPLTRTPKRSTKTNSLKKRNCFGCTGTGVGTASSTSTSTSSESGTNCNGDTVNHGNVNGHINVELDGVISLEERLRRERQRLHSNGITQFTWTATACSDSNSNSDGCDNTQPPDNNMVRMIVPLHGNIYIQDGVGPNALSPLRILYDKSMLEQDICQTNTITAQKKGTRDRKSKKGKNSSIKSVVGRDAGAIDPQLSPDGSMVAFVVAGEIYVMSCGDEYHSSSDSDHGQSEEGCGVSSYDDNDGDNDDGRNDTDSSRDSNINGMVIDSENDVCCENMIGLKPTRVTFGAMIGDSIEEEDDDDDESDSSSEESDTIGDRDTKVKKHYGRSITHGLADFVAQEEMDRYRGFWWDKESQGILFVRVDESCVPPYRITHQGKDGIAGDESNYEDHRYPFAGEHNPEIDLGYISINRRFILTSKYDGKREVSSSHSIKKNKSISESNWSRVKWFDPPTEASEYLARVNWLPDGSACVQWEDRRQTKLVLVKIDIKTGDNIVLHKEESDVWINLHHMFKVLPNAIHPSECLTENQDEAVNAELPNGSFSFLFASERTGYCHIYLYTFVPGDFSATLLRAVTAGEWIVESIAGVDMENDLVYVTGTYDSPLEKHLYSLPLRKTKSSKTEDENAGVLGVRRGFKQVMNTFSGASSAPIRKHQTCSFDHAPPVCADTPPDPIRLTNESGMHSIVMDETCRLFVDTSSDLTRPPATKVYSISKYKGGGTSLLFVLYDSTLDLKDDTSKVSVPELISFPTSDESETLHAALYRPDPSVHGSGPHPLICAVYGGPHVQRVNRSWGQCADMRAQRLCSLGFVVVKCDNRGSSRRGLAFEGAIKKNLGRVEVLDQVAAVRHLVTRRIADSTRVGIYGWSYGGYLAAMCLCRAPDVFHVAIAGAPVTSWDGYDTHYTERYMGMPSENAGGYHEAAVFQHIHNLRGKLMIIHGLIDENVHFRHTARLINRLISGGKDYDLLIFPDERHSPRRLRDRVYMEKRMSDYFVKNLLGSTTNGRRGVLLRGHL